MKEPTKFVLLLLIELSSQIYVPDENINQKPITYSSGIRTRPSQLEYHHNYSRVYHQNNEGTFHNAHTYGQRPPYQVYVLNGTRVRKNDNPARRVLIYNKQKRSPKIEIHRTCPRNATGQFVYEASCNQYLNCWKGRGYVQNCAPGTLFNPKSLECDFPHKVSCVSGPRHTILQRESSTRHVRQVGCPKDFSGLIPNYTDCSKFINCVSGIENLMDCPPGTLFDVNKNICDFAHKAACFNGQNQDLVEQNIDGKLDFESGVRSHERLSYRFSEARCPEGSTGLYPHPIDCTKFLNCANGLTYVQSCSPGTLFNPVLKICDFPYNVRCQNGTGAGISVVDYDAGYYGRRNSTRQQGSNSYGYGYHGSRDQAGYYGSSTSRYGNQESGYTRYGSTTSRSGYYGNYGNEDSGHQGNSYGSSVNQYRPNSYYNQNSGYNDNTSSQYYGTSSGNQYRPSGYDSTGYYGGSGNQYRPTSYGNQNSGYDGTSSGNQYRPSSYGNQNSGYDGTGNQYTPSSYGTSSGNQYIPSSYGNHNSGYKGNSSGNQYRPSSYGNQNSGYDGTSSGNQYTPSSENQHIPSSYGNHNSGYKGTSSGNQYRPSSYGNQNSGYDSAGNQYRPTSYDNQNSGYDSTLNQSGYYGSSGNQYRPTTYGNQNSRYDNNQYRPNGAHDSTSVNQYRPSSYDNQHSGYDGTSGQSGYYGSSVNQYRPNTYTKQNSGYGSTSNQPISYGNHDSTQNRPSSYGNRDGYYGSYGNQDSTGYSKGQPEETLQRPYDGRFTVIPDSSLSQSPWSPSTARNWYDRGTTPNYDEVVNINHARKTPKSNDYDDTFGPGHSSKFIRATTPRIMEKNWPPPFPSTDVNADYVFEYGDDDQVSLEAENSLRDDDDCGKSHFRCSNDRCVPKTLVCNGVKDCPGGQDELKCLEYVSKFSVQKNKKLAILEKERWDNVSIATCALLCVQSQKLRCRSFNYRKVDRTCLLTNTNEGTTGALINYQPFDYYELISERIDCSNMHVCSNRKCINKAKICDGQDDCGDRMDEKGCKAQNFGYSIRLTDSKNRNEGHIQVTAFGKTGYICDDNFGLRDAEVACKELGFHLGAVEVKKNSFYSRNVSEKPFYMMDDVTCSGNESKLMDCDFSGWGVHNCLGQEIVGVVCKTPQEKCPDDYWQCDTGQECLPLAFVCDGLLDCTDGSDEGSQHCDAPTQIRLANGTGRQEGRVEIRHHGIWGTVCDDDFNEDAAKVVCKQLGYRGSAFVRKEGYFGAGSGPIWLDQVFCSGNESSIESCTHWNWGEHNCEHGEDVGVVCSNVHEYERHSMVPVQTSPREYPDVCGLRKDNIFNRGDDVHFRVVKGSVARRGEYPWQAAIRVKGKTAASHWCGAVIISEKFVLTAAHCLIGYSKGAYVIVAGDYNVDEDEGTEQEAYIEDFYIHEKFREGHKMNNDIALVKLKGRGFTLNDDVQAICLPDSGTSYETDQNCTISGFGSIQSGKSAFSHDLRAGWVPLQKRQVCTMPHVYGDAMTEGMICAGFLDEGIDSCDGDSGGPLACLNQGVFTLYGITSWGQHCGYANKPGVYVKVAHYRKWIDDNFYKHSST